MRDLPRVVWILAAGRLVNGAGTFVYFYLFLYLTGPRHVPLGTAGLVSGGPGAGLLGGEGRARWAAGPAPAGLRRAGPPVGPGARPAAGAGGPRRAGLWRSLRADRALLGLLPAVVVVDVFYRQIFCTLPVFLRDHGHP